MPHREYNLCECPMSAPHFACFSRENLSERTSKNYDRMGTLHTTERLLVDVSDNMLPFLDDEDAIALSESVLAPKPKPRPVLKRCKSAALIRFPILIGDNWLKFYDGSPL